MHQVFIVIVNFNGLKDTLECLKSVKKCVVRGAKCKIAVVDNGSKADDVRELKKLKGIKLIESKVNTGFTGGNNLGIKYALKEGADYILLLNNDTTVDKDFLEILLETADLYDNAGIFTPKIYFAPGFEFHKDKYSKQERGHVIWSAGGVIDWNNVYGQNYGVDDTDIGQYEKIQETHFATGAAMLVRKEVFEQIGFFDDKLFLYFEDVEFCQRAKAAGWKIMFVPDSKVWHKVSQSSGIGSDLNDYYITRNRLLFGTKFAPFRSKVALLRESVRLLKYGRKWQKIGALDFYKGKFGKGSWK